MKNSPREKENIFTENIPPKSELFSELEDPKTVEQMEKTIEGLKQRLESSENRFRNIINKNADAIVIVNQKGRVCFVNPSAEYLFNCSFNELLEMEFFGSLVAESSAIEINIDTEIMFPLGDEDYHGLRVAQTEVEVIRKGQENAIVAMRLVEIEWEGEIAYLATLRDITQRKRTEEMLWLYSRAMAATSTGIVIADATHPEIPMIYCNPAFEKLTGYSKEEALGHNCRFLQGEETDKNAILQIRKALNQKTGCRVILKNYRKDGSYFWNELSISPVRDRQGKLTHYIGVQLDVTERKQAEEELQKSEQQLREQTLQLQNTLQQLQQTHSQLVQSEKMSSLGVLLAGVAHEINNPVTFINGNLEHLNNYIKDLLELIHVYQENYPQPVTSVQEKIEAIELDFLEEDLTKILASMEVGIDRICQIVKSLRNFARMDESELKSMSLHEGIDSTLLILNHRLKPKGDNPGIKIIKNYGEIPLVDCYVGPMNQVFMNILSNAIDALEESQTSHSSEDAKKHPSQITIHTIPLDRDFIEIRIEDNGPGISPEVQTRIFDTFFTTKPVGKGTGMGLSISYQIVVEKHQGELSCISELGKGCKFVIKLPIKQQTSSP